jgi:hypothetical protein
MCLGSGFSYSDYCKSIGLVNFIYSNHREKPYLEYLQLKIRNRGRETKKLIKYYSPDIIRRKRQVTCMRGFGECILIFLLFFIAAAALLEIDRNCREMTGFGGDITASAEFLIEKSGGLG